MVHYASVLVFALLVGISSAYPQTRRTQNFRRQTNQVDADANLDAVIPDEVVTTTAPILAKSLQDIPQDFVETDSNSIDGSNSDDADNTLGLPSNATSIRAKIVDTFSCEGKVYGYYADVENECQIFHVCLPVQQPGSKGRTFKWSFICPEQTIFNQEVFTCTRPEDAPPCGDAPNYYRLNDNFGVTSEPEGRKVEGQPQSRNDDGTELPETPAETPAEAPETPDVTTPPTQEE